MSADISDSLRQLVAERAAITASADCCRGRFRYINMSLITSCLPSMGEKPKSTTSR